MNRNKVCAVAGVLAGAALLAGACAGTASAMASGNGGKRIEVIQGSGTAHAKKGALTASWAWGSTWGRQITPYGDWTGAVHGNGYVKGNGYSASWSW
jgi:hypothetical protein